MLPRPWNGEVFWTSAPGFWQRCGGSPAATRLGYREQASAPGPKATDEPHPTPVRTPAAPLQHLSMDVHYLSCGIGEPRREEANDCGFIEKHHREGSEVVVSVSTPGRTIPCGKQAAA